MVERENVKSGRRRVERMVVVVMEESSDGKCYMHSKLYVQTDRQTRKIHDAESGAF